MATTRTAIFTGGDAPHPGVSSHLDPFTLVIAADGGHDHAVSCGFPPDVVIGDMDSIAPSSLAEAERRGIEIIRHRSDKDATDTELALDLARERRSDTITIVSGGGDRIDHVLGFLHSAAGRATPTVEIALWIGGARIDLVSAGAPRRITIGRSALVSLVPLGGPATSVTTTNLRWGLAGEMLEVYSSRGVSNVALGPTIEVGLDAGVVAVIQPYFFADLSPISDPRPASDQRQSSGRPTP